MSGKWMVSASRPLTHAHAVGQAHSRASLRQWVGACLLWALAGLFPAAAQSAAPSVSRAVEVPPPADWKPGAPLFADEGPVDSGRSTPVSAERAKQVGEPRVPREHPEAAVLASKPPSQRVTTKPLALAAKKPNDPGRGKALDQTRPKAQGVARARGEAGAQAKPPRASRVAGSGLNPTRRAAGARDGVRQRAGRGAGQGTQNKTVRAAARGLKPDKVSAKVSEKVPRAAASKRQAARSNGAAAAKTGQDRPRAKRPAPQSTRSAQPARSARSAKAERPPSPRASTRPVKREARGARSQPATPGDAKQAVRRAR